MDELKQELLGLLRTRSCKRGELHALATYAVEPIETVNALRALVDDELIQRDADQVYHLIDLNAVCEADADLREENAGQAESAEPSTRKNVKSVAAGEPTAAERVVDAMRQIGKPVTRGDIEAYTGMPRKTVDGTTLRLRARGQIEVVGSSGKMQLYALADGAPTAPVPPPVEQPQSHEKSAPATVREPEDADHKPPMIASDDAYALAMGARLQAQLDEAESLLNRHIQHLDDPLLVNLTKTALAARDALSAWEARYAH